MIEEEKGDSTNYPTSLKSKIIIKDKLNQILKKMDSEHPLTEFAEDLEYETKGKFTFLELKEILDQKFPKLLREEKIFLLKYIPLTSIGINQKSPFITLLNLFIYFEKIIEEKIFSPSLILYKTAETLKNKYNTSTLEFIYSIGLYSSSVINLSEFYIKFAPKLNLDDISCMIIFKGLDYKSIGKIKIKDFIMVLDSFRDNSYDNRYIYPRTMKEEEKNAIILKLFLDKNSINIDKFFGDGETNFMNYSDLKNNIMKEISNNQNNFKEKEPINEKMLDSILLSVSRNYKIFKEDLENFMENSKLETVHKYIKLNDIQKYWIKRYIKILESLNITPKMAFESAAQAKSPNLMNLEDLKRQLRILLPNGRISVSELNNMMDVLDMDKNKMIDKPKYNKIIKQINLDINSDIKNKEEIIKSINDKSANLWNTSIKSTYYHLLPVKGNYDILFSLNRDINENVLYKKKKKDEDNNKNHFTYNKFKEEKMGLGDKNINYNNKSLNETKNMEINKIINNNGEYTDKHKLIEIFENFRYHKLDVPCFDFILYLKKNNISKNRSFEIIKYLDMNSDGYISISEILNFVLKDLTFRSTKLLYKFLYLKIYKDLGFPSSEDFFSRYNFNLYDGININDLAKFYAALNIELPLIIKSYNELRSIFKPPLIYKNICELIDYYKNDPLINNYGPSEDVEEKCSLSINDFNLQMKNFVYGLLNKKDTIKEDYTRAKRIQQKLKPIMKNCVDKMNLSQYNLFFSRPLNMEPILSTSIFQLLKTIMPNGEQLLDKNVLLMFIESYSGNSHLSNLNDLKNNKNKEAQKAKSIQKIMDVLDSYASPIKFVFESIPFRKSGLIPSSELMKYLQKFYGGIMAKNDLMYIIKNLDDNKKGFINYNQIQMFLYNFSKKYKCSMNIELKLITCNIYKKKYKSGEEYFMNDEFKGIVKNYQKITKRQHFKLYKELCSSFENRKELYYYLTRLSGASTYDLRYVTDVIDGYLEMDYYNKEIYEQYEQTSKVEKLNKSKKEDFNEKLPEKKVFEKVIQNINLGDNGNIFMNQLLRQIPEDCQKTVKNYYDYRHLGYLSFPDFINISRDIYGQDINLNYKLCAQYIYKKYIKSPELVQSYLLQKVNETDITTYLTFDIIYSNFMYAFANDKFLFEDFYKLYKEKKGKYIGMLKLHSFQQFIFYNNPELKAFAKVNFIKSVKEEIISEDNNIIKDLIKKKLISIREIIDMINVEECNLKKDFTIKEEYMKKILNKNFDYTEEEISIFCNFFRFEEYKFNLKKFFLYDKETQNNKDIILNEEIIPKIKEHILHSNILNFRQYRLKYFKVDFLTINEVYLKFSNLYNLTLFHSLLIVIDNQYLSIDKFFKDYELKDLFPEKEYDPTLKTTILRLNTYFEEHKDKLKIFKEIDIDKNGVLSKEEFITLLNSMEDLNLEDNQKYKLLTVADKSKNGKINSKEFLSFIKSAKYLSDSAMINEIKSNFYNINKKNLYTNSKFIPRFLNDITVVEKNLEINKKLFTEENRFLNAIIILQKDIFNNFYKYDSIEQDFNIADSEKTGKVSFFKFNSILKKRLFTLKDKNFKKFIDLAYEALDKDFIESLKNEKMIDYKNFLNNLVNYHEDNKEQKSWESDKNASASVVNNENEKEGNDIYSSGNFIEETKVKKVKGDEVDIINKFGKIESKNKNEEEDNGKDENEKSRKSEGSLLEEDSSKKENIVNKSESQFTYINENNINEEDNKSTKRQIFENNEGINSEKGKIGKDEKKLLEGINNAQINDKKEEENSRSENYKKSISIGNSVLAE